jgi:hypothetical protein
VFELPSFNADILYQENRSPIRDTEHKAGAYPTNQLSRIPCISTGAPYVLFREPISHSITTCTTCSKSAYYRVTNVLSLAVRNHSEPHSVTPWPRCTMKKDPNLRRSNNNADRRSQWARRAVFTPVNKAGIGVIEYNSTDDSGDLGLILIDRGQNQARLESLRVCLWLVAAVLHI